MTESNKNKLATWVPIVLALLSFVAGGGWVQTYLLSTEKTEQENIKLITGYLAPIETLLDDNKAIFNRIYSKHRVGNWGVLESYVNRVNQNPPYAQLSIMRKDIATISSNNSEIVGLLKSYAGYAFTEKLKSESTKFRRHAIEWNNRWAAIPEVIKSGIQLPYAEPFPKEFSKALKAELNDRRK